jgi:hypothetical protein
MTLSRRVMLAYHEPVSERCKFVMTFLDAFQDLLDR